MHARLYRIWQGKAGDMQPADSTASFSALIGGGGGDSEPPTPTATDAAASEPPAAAASGAGSDSKLVSSARYKVPGGLHERWGWSETVFAGWPYVKGGLDFYKANPLRLKNEILSGLTVAIAQVPESVAFSFVAGVDPLVGLYATFFLGLVTAQIGGRPGMVSGAAGAMAVVAKVVMDTGGLFPEEKLLARGDIAVCAGAGCESLRDQAYAARRELLFLTMWIVGILQILCGVFQLGSLVRLIPQTVMVGFVNGLGIIIFMAQLESFQEVDWQKAFGYFDTDTSGTISEAEVMAVFAQQLPDMSAAVLGADVSRFMDETDANGDGFIDFAEFSADEKHSIHDGYDEVKKWRVLSDTATWIMLAYVFGSMFIVHYLPKLTKAVPSSLVSICACLFVEHVIVRPASDFETPTVSDMSPVKGGLPEFKLPDVQFDSDAFGTIMPTAVSLCLVGLIESILTLQLVDEILDDTSDSTGRCTQECIAQGIANLLSAMFQSMGGDAMIGQSTINVKSGGIGRLSTTFASIMFLIFIVAASSVIELVPIAALTGVLFMVVIYTFDWSCLRLMTGDLRAAAKTGFKTWPSHRCRWQDSFLIVLVTVVTVLTNLAYAVIIGVVVAALFYAWDNSTELKCRRSVNGEGRVTYALTGVLFFGTDRAFKNHFDIAGDSGDVVIDLCGVPVKDYSGLLALESLGRRYSDKGLTVTVRTTFAINGRIFSTFGKRLESAKLEWEEKSTVADAI